MMDENENSGQHPVFMMKINPWSESQINYALWHLERLKEGLSLFREEKEDVR